ncbi:MAG: ABC transporter permease [Victivallaceae bacterium]
MKKYLFRKLVSNLISLWIVFSITFWIMRSIPGDPFTYEDGNPLSEETIEILKNQCGLSEPLYRQYFKYLKATVKFDFGNSLVYRDRSVRNIIASSFPVSAILGLQSSFLAIIFGLFMGWTASLKTKKYLPKIVSGSIMLQISVPGFILATLLQYFLAFKCRLFPIACWGSFSHTILPSVSLAAVPAAFIAKLTKSSFASLITKDFILSAQAKGLSRTGILFRHALPHAFFPVLSYLNFMITNLITGTFAVENIFGIPGLGKWFTQSVLQRDYPVIIGLAVFYGVFFMTGSLIIDLMQAGIDPQIRRNL